MQGVVFQFLIGLLRFEAPYIISSTIHVDPLYMTSHSQEATSLRQEEADH